MVAMAWNIPYGNVIKNGKKVSRQGIVKMSFAHFKILFIILNKNTIQHKIFNLIPHSTGFYIAFPHAKLFK